MSKNGEFFDNFFNLAAKQRIDTQPKTAPEWKFGFNITIDQEVNVIDVYFGTLKTILTDLGGYYSALFHITLLLVSPILFWHFNRSIV